ncbi:MAG TPA: hypothetical protein VKU88_09300 [Acidimicrobiales bacterium]|nr:hypothetical protein [Acidimicrobiales bacterium]
MELLLAFAIGWAVGAKGGEQGFREVVEAARELRRSEEFAALVDAFRRHLAGTLKALAEALGDSSRPLTPEAVLERLAGRGGDGASPSS